MCTWEVREIDARLSKSNRIAGIMNYLLRAKQLSRTKKFRLYRTVIRPTALHGCETWVLNQTTEEIRKQWKRKLPRTILGGKRLKTDI